MRTHTATLFELLREEEVHATVDFLIRQDGGNASAHYSSPSQYYGSA
jgi:hypothetical protein